MPDRDHRPRILLVTRNLPPLVGGMERLNQRMIEGLAQWANLFVVGPRGCSEHVPTEVPVSEVPANPLWAFLSRGAFASFLAAWKFKPDLVFAGSGLTAPLAWLVARLLGVPAVVYVHGLDLVAAHPVYRLFWLPAIRRSEIVVANSSNTRELALKVGVPKTHLNVVNPGVDVPRPDSQARHRFRLSLGPGVGPILLAVGRLTPRKGLVQFVEHCLPAILRIHPDALLVVVGNDAPDALNSPGGCRAELVSTAARLGLTASLRLVGACSNETLEDAYQGSDVHVFPVRDVPGDVEGFGMVAIEAASYGLPTVAFDVGGVSDAVIDGVTGRLVEPGRYAAFAEEVLGWIRARARAGTDRCAMAAQRFEWTRFNDEMKAILTREPNAV